MVFYGATFGEEAAFIVAYLCRRVKGKKKETGTF